MGVQSGWVGRLCAVAPDAPNPTYKVSIKITSSPSRWGRDPTVPLDTPPPSTDELVGLNGDWLSHTYVQFYYRQRLN